MLFLFLKHSCAKTKKNRERTLLQEKLEKLFLI